MKQFLRGNKLLLQSTIQTITGADLAQPQKRTNPATLERGNRFALAWKTYLLALYFFILLRFVLLTASVHALTLKPLEFLYIFGVGLLYDTVYYLYALIPVSLYFCFMPAKWWNTKWNDYFLRFMMFATIFVIGFTMVAEYLFWDEFSTRFNFIAVDYLVYTGEVTKNIFESYPVAWLLLAVTVLSYLCYRLFFAGFITEYLQQENKPKVNFALFGANLALALLAYFTIGQQLRDAQPSTVVRELASNGPYQLFAAFRNNELNYEVFYQTSDAETNMEIMHKALNENGTKFQSNQPYDIKRAIINEGEEKKYNVMMIMVESLSANFLGTFGNKEGITPNLDALAKQSLLFTNMYATGTRTTRGLEAVTMSTPPTPGRSIVKRTGKEADKWTLGNVLRNKNYDVKFLYGGLSYFDNMKAFFGGNGYDIIDQASVPSKDIGFENAWGMSDEYIFNQALEQAHQSTLNGKPFFYHIMTTSNHRPYTYPDNRIDIPSGTGRNGAVKYTDWAIGDFISKARNEPWFDNTIFVIVADHTAGAAGKEDLPIDRYRIPLLIYAPAIIKSQKNDIITSQIDIAPTLLSILHMNYDSAFFGKDMLTMKPEDGRAFISNYQHLGLYSDGELTILSPQKIVNSYKVTGKNRSVMVPHAEPDEHEKLTLAYYTTAYHMNKSNLNQWSAQTHANE